MGSEDPQQWLKWLEEIKKEEEPGVHDPDEGDCDNCE